MNNYNRFKRLEPRPKPYVIIYIILKTFDFNRVQMADLEFRSVFLKVGDINII